MRLGLFLSQMINPELEEIRKKANFTVEEERIFSMLSKGQSINQIALETNLSSSTVERRISSLKRKVVKVCKL